LIYFARQKIGRFHFLSSNEEGEKRGAGSTTATATTKPLAWGDYEVEGSHHPLPLNHHLSLFLFLFFFSA